MGYIKPYLKFDEEIKANVYSSLYLSLILSVVLSFIAYNVSLFLGIANVSLALLLFISIVSSMLSGVFLTFLSILISILTYRKGWDPDNLTTPLLAAMGDITMICFLMLSIELAFMVGL